MARKTNHYLKNKELLRQIHISKMSYSWLLDDKYFMYDAIINDLSEITDDIIAEAKVTQSKRLQKTAHTAEVKKWEAGELKQKTKPKAAKFAVDVDTIPDTDLTIRVMSFDHIPLEQRKKTPRTVADNHSKCNFPPFKQYALIDDAWTEAGRSHWDGDLANGEFSVTHGTTTQNLAKGYMMLCQRYSMRSNWRGYTYVDEMRGQAILQLSQIGLQFNEAKSENPFAYYTAAVNNSFTRILNLEKRNQNIRDDLLEENGLNPSSTRTFNAEWASELSREEKANAGKIKITTFELEEVEVEVEVSEEE
jgi:hypothetical protein